MACVRKRRGKWIADYRDHKGKRHWETFETRKEAEQELAKHVTALKDGRYTPANDKRTVRDAFESWWRLSVEGSDNRSGKPLRATTRGLYLWTWTAHVEPRWGAVNLRQVEAEAIATWKAEKLAGCTGARTMLCAMQVLGSVFRHARRFKWTTADPLDGVHRPKHEYQVKAFTPEQLATHLEV